MPNAPLVPSPQFTFTAHHAVINPLILRIVTHPPLLLLLHHHAQSSQKDKPQSHEQKQSIDNQSRDSPPLIFGLASPETKYHAINAGNDVPHEQHACNELSKFLVFL